MALTGQILEEEKEYLRQFYVLGDDFRGLVRKGTAKLLDRTIYRVFGTVTSYLGGGM